MQSVVCPRLTGWFVRVTCAIALLFVGLTHQVPGIASGAFASSALADQVLPDGTLPVICTDGSKRIVDHHGKMHGHGCEACRIAASTLLPSPDLTDVVRLRIDTEVTQPSMREASNEEPFAPNRGPRAPPPIPVFG
ncbi:hypothetical protein ATY81_08355 [Rhizobium sp. R72]|nr:hypothetical protein ATY81_08355 [Rhizobium sp. R72]OWV97940.1 hypothetical protein ATY80_08355 [Rhizobium sp. R711]